MPKLIKQALATAPVRLCATLLITPPLLAVSEDQAVPHSLSEQIVFLSYTTPFKPSNRPLPYLIRHLEAGSSYLERPGHLEAG